MDRTRFTQFMESKRDWGANSGFKPLYMPDFLFDFQKYLTERALLGGRHAIFADCGMGKTPIEFAVGQNFLMKTNKPVLLLTPLAVSFQMLEEAEKFGVDVVRAVPGKNPKCIQVTNYQQLHKFDAHNYGAVICDESSILKNPKGFTKGQITEFMRVVPYRMLATATAAPNDFEELGTSSEALGYYGYQDMIDKFFTKKSKNIERGFNRDKVMLREYAKDAFWQWIASWSTSARKPSDLGFDDDGFILPGLIENDIEVEVHSVADGMLFDLEATDNNSEREVIKRTIPERCEMAAQKVAEHNISMVWCHRNAESSLLHKLIPNSVEIKGSDSDEKREEAVKWFVRGTDEQRRLISKPRIFGFGMNFQHAHHMTYFPTHSYEQYYQARARELRFGQKEVVIVDRIYTNGGIRILRNLDRKARQADEMFTLLVANMHNAMELHKEYHSIKKMEVPQWMQ